MRVLISGGSGFIGRALTKSLLKDGHSVAILTRNPKTARIIEGVEAIKWDGRTEQGWGEQVSRADAIVNLAGRSLASFPWTAKRKEAFRSSRVWAGQAITAAIRKARSKPGVLIQASAVGFYGPHGGEMVTEQSAAGTDYQAELCVAWEASTLPVEEMGVRRVVIRTGVVLSKNEGALPRMLFPFRLFAGGPLGDGNQGFPWIHPDDEVAAIRFLMERKDAQGVYNLSAPQPLSNADFGRELARVMKRPYWFPAPAFALRLLLGEMAALVLEGQYMIPEHLMQAGYHFHFETARDALTDVMAKQ